MVYVLVILAGFAFGALDQYLGTVHVTQHVGWWTITVSGMSAPWLIVPFLAGMAQDRPRKAAGLGLLVTMCALLGYFWMSNSAFEGVALDRTLPRMEAMIRGDTNLLWIAGGLITGPLFGYLGHRWRVARSWVAAVVVACALCLEPFARASIGTRIIGGLNGSRVVWGTEMAIGVIAAVVFAWVIVVARREREAPASSSR